jgi:hypothetical protein
VQRSQPLRIATCEISTRRINGIFVKDRAVSSLENAESRLETVSVDRSRRGDNVHRITRIQM